MDPTALDGLDREPHGGVFDSEVLDFSANVNPERPPGVAQQYDLALSISRRHPSDDYSSFRAAVADYIGCNGRNVIPTAGSIQGLRLLLEVTLSPGDSVLIPTPSFGEYRREVRMQGAHPECVSHEEFFGADPSRYELAIVGTPNNVTGQLVAEPALRSFAATCYETGTPLLINEEYLDYTGTPSFAETPGVVVVRSLTNVFGLPGLRVGYLVATGALRDRLAIARPQWNLSVPGAIVGEYCLRQPEFVERTRERIAEERQRVSDRLSKRYEVYPSDAPFVLFDTAPESVDSLVDRTRSHGIIVRDARTFDGLDSHVRVAIKRPHENERLLEAIGV